MSRSIAERRAEAGRATVSLIFADAGHDLDPSFLEPIEAPDGAAAEAIGRAKLRTWDATLQLFRAALTSESETPPTRP